MGHIVLGLRLLAAKFDKIAEFSAPKLRMLVEHLIISHHGELAFGSPKVPEFAEAVLLHQIDNMDSKMETVRNALQRDKSVEGEFTGWVSSLERVLLKKDRFLQEAPAPVPVAAKAEAKREVKLEVKVEQQQPLLIEPSSCRARETRTSASAAYTSGPCQALDEAARETGEQHAFRRKTAGGFAEVSRKSEC